MFPSWIPLYIPEHVGHNHGGDHLNDLVADAGPTAHREGEEVGRALERPLGGDEPLRHVLQRPVPQLRGVVAVVVVDEHHGVRFDAVACTPSGRVLIAITVS